MFQAPEFRDDSARRPAMVVGVVMERRQDLQRRVLLSTNILCRPRAGNKRPASSNQQFYVEAIWASRTGTRCDRLALAQQVTERSRAKTVVVYNRHARRSLKECTQDVVGLRTAPVRHLPGSGGAESSQGPSLLRTVLIADSGGRPNFRPERGSEFDPPFNAGRIGAVHKANGQYLAYRPAAPPLFRRSAAC